MPCLIYLIFNWSTRGMKFWTTQGSNFLVEIMYQISISIKNQWLLKNWKWKQRKHHSHWCLSGIFIANFKQISYVVLVFLLLTLNKNNASWEFLKSLLTQRKRDFQTYGCLVMRIFCLAEKIWSAPQNVESRSTINKTTTGTGIYLNLVTLDYS